MDTSPAVVCYGEIGVDSIIRLPELPTPEHAVFPTSESEHPGGAALNTAAWLVGWGVQTRLAGNAIGLDAHGQQLWGWMSEFPTLDLTCVQRLDIPTPFCRVFVTPDGNRSFLIYHYPTTPKPELTAEVLNGARYLALDLYGGPTRLAAAQLARARGVPTVIGDVVALDHPALPLTDIACNSAAFVRHTFPGVDALAHCRSLQAISQGIVTLTDGAHCVTLLDADGAAFTVQPPAVEPVDATGAGDAFRAGLIYGLLHGWPLPKAAQYATAAGSLKVLRVGGGSNPAPVEEVSALAQTLPVQAL